MISTTTEQSTYLGPARVGVAAGNRVRLDFPDQQVWAQMAVAFPYQAVVDDVVLAISQDDRWYVIGVIEGRGETCFTAPADIQINAPRGRIELSSAEGVEIRSPEVKVTASKLELFAKSVFEKFFDATRWVKNAFDFRARSVHSRVEETQDVKAKRIVQRAEEEVKIDGKKVKLG